MDIDNLTIGEAKRLASLFGASSTVGNPMIGKHCVVRCYAAGLHLGTVKEVIGDGVLLENARRIWKWEGAFTLSEVSQFGIAKSSRIAVEIPAIFLTGVCELIPTTETARKTFEACHEK